MRMRTVEISVGLFMVAGFVALFFLALKVSGLAADSNQPTYRLYAHYQNAGGLAVRSKVTMAGVTIGRVSAIELDPKTLTAKVTLDIYRSEGLLQRARALAPHLEQGVHSLKGLPNVIDIRNYGLIGAVEFEPRPGKPATRAYDVFTKCFERGVLVRAAGDTIAVSPPLIVEEAQLERIFAVLGQAIRDTA